MSGSVPISLAVEDELSEHLLRALLRQSGRGFVIGAVYGKRGAAYLKCRLRGFNLAARHSTWLVLTDLDARECVPTLIQEWFACPLAEYPARRQPNLLFRVAAREAEAWVMADREQFAGFLGIATKAVPVGMDAVDDPKGLLLRLAAQSRNRQVRDDLLPRPGERRTIGPNYNGRLGEFLHSRWRAKAACVHSNSLARAWKRLIAFHPTGGSSGAGLPD